MIKKKLSQVTYDYEFDNFIVSASFNPESKTVTIFSKNKEAFFKTGNLQKNYVNALANILCEIGQDFDVLNNPKCYPVEDE